jgi:serine/threonine-protein kinase
VVTHKVVAVKRLVQALRGDPLQRARLTREAEALAAISHPNVVSVLDAGTEVDGAPYVVLEYLDARTLEGLIAARGRLAVLDALSVVRQACNAVAAVHDAGFVHRDVKPGNMLIIQSDASNDLRRARLKLVDFGIIAAPWFDLGGNKLTKPDAIIGTPEYMPVERLRATSGVTTPTEDVYALGVTLYECLTGQVPFEGAPMQVMSEVLASPPPQVRRTHPDVPDIVAQILDTSLARDSSQRYRDARAMAQAIDIALAELSTSAGPPAAPAGATRRRAVRAPYLTPVRVDFAGGSFDGRTEDLCEGGALVMLPDVLPNGTQVQVRFALPLTGELLKAHAIVRWSKRNDVASRAPCAVGIEFSNLEPRARAAIAQFVGIVGQQSGVTP